MKVSAVKIEELKGIFKRKPSRLGLEIEGDSVRIVRLSKKGEGAFNVAAYGELPIDIWHAGAMDQQRFRAAIKQLGAGIVRVAVNIEHPSLRVRRMSLPKMPEQDMFEAIKWNFREHVEGSVEDYVVGYTPIEGVSEPGRAVVMAYGVTKEAIKDRVQLMKSLGLKPVSVEPASTALLAAFHANGLLDDGKHHICIAFGDQTTVFMVLAGDAMLFSRPMTGISEDNLIRLLTRNLNTEERESREVITSWIKMFGAPLTAPEVQSEKDKRVETTLGHYYSQLVVEVQRSIDAFCIMYGVEKVDDIYLCGKGAFYPGICERMTKSLGVQTSVFKPFDKMLEDSKKSDEVLHLSPLYAVSVGLAIP